MAAAVSWSGVFPLNRTVKQDKLRHYKRLSPVPHLSPRERQGVVDAPPRLPAEGAQAAGVAEEEGMSTGRHALRVLLDARPRRRRRPSGARGPRASTARGRSRCCRCPPRLPLLRQQAVGVGAVVDVDEVARGRRGRRPRAPAGCSPRRMAASCGRRRGARSFGACPGPTRLNERATTAPWARASRSAAALVSA